MEKMEEKAQSKDKISETFNATMSGEAELRLHLSLTAWQAVVA